MVLQNLGSQENHVYLFTETLEPYKLSNPSIQSSSELTTTTHTWNQPSAPANETPTQLLLAMCTDTVTGNWRDTAVPGHVHRHSDRELKADEGSCWIVLKQSREQSSSTFIPNKRYPSEFSTVLSAEATRLNVTTQKPSYLKCWEFQQRIPQYSAFSCTQYHWRAAAAQHNTEQRAREKFWSRASLITQVPSVGSGRQGEQRQPRAALAQARSHAPVEPNRAGGFRKAPALLLLLTK